MAGFIHSIRDDPVIHRRGLLERRANQVAQSLLSTSDTKQTRFPFFRRSEQRRLPGSNPFRGKGHVKETSILKARSGERDDDASTEKGIHSSGRAQTQARSFTPLFLSERVTTSPWILTEPISWQRLPRQRVIDPQARPGQEIY